MIAALSVRALTLRRGERRLFQDFDLDLAAGEAVALTGPNGAGKTSLLRAIAGFIRPEAGAIVFQGDGGPLEPDEARRAGVHLLGHQDGLKGNRTARDELMFQVRWTGGTDATALAASQTLGLARLLDLAVRHLSAGQRRRLALARLVASPRALWLLDEPLAPLDAQHRGLFGELMAAHLAGGGLVLAAVHDPLPIAARTVELAG
ncbi:MAG TPA: heme ABC exporter ATP-binding protein CcmA [Caulobacteraceae bacterium]|nr:heme ABC exporter ATP-binding protein CcmA [Caulobacteraceae bacterium]